MKSCPKCNNKYTDMTLRFCLQDGTELVEESADKFTNPTVSFGETETIVSSRQTDQRINDQLNSGEQFRQDDQTANSSDLQNELKSSKPIVPVLLTVLIMLLLFGFIGIGVYFYLNKENRTVTVNNNNSKSSIDNPYSKAGVDVNNLDKITTPKYSPTPKETTSPTPRPTPDTNPEETKKAIAITINDWKSLAESKNLSAYMKIYASKVDYYNKKSINQNSVRADKQKAFDKYDTIKIQLSNINLSPDEAGQNAVAVFDKEWIFVSEDGQNSGKVQSQLKLSKVEDKWLITSEKDLKVYYVNK